MFIGFPDKLIDDLVLKKEYGKGKRNHQDRASEGDIKKYFLEESQKFKKW